MEKKNSVWVLISKDKLFCHNILSSALYNKKHFTAVAVPCRVDCAFADRSIG